MPGIDLIAERKVSSKDYRKVLYREGNDHYVALTHFNRNAQGRLEMWNVFKVDPLEYCPAAPANVKIAPACLISTCHVKYPTLRLWSDLQEIPKKLEAIRARTTREVSVCEILAKHPHPNVAEYVGCIFEDGFIKGIVYERYDETLNDAVNVGGVGKRSFQYGQYPLERGRKVLLRELSDAVQHLHSLGIVHNDVKPTNVMLDFEGVAVLIDFDSCLPVGASCHDEEIGRTEGWCNFEKELSLPGNDLLAVLEIREWLSDRRAKNYIF